MGLAKVPGIGQRKQRSDQLGAPKLDDLARQIHETLERAAASKRIDSEEYQECLRRIGTVSAILNELTGELTSEAR